MATRMQLLAIFLTIFVSVDAARILGLCVFPAKSHGQMTNTILLELARRGHEVFAITNTPIGKNLTNFTEIEVTPAYDFWPVVHKAVQLPGIFEMHTMGFVKSTIMVNVAGLGATEHALRSENVQKLIHSTDQHFDLIIAEQFFQEAFLMFAHKFKAPIITMGTFGYGSYMSDLMGSFGAWAYVPHHTQPFDSNRMTIVDRIQNVAVSLYERYQRAYTYLPAQQEMADKYFAHLPEPKPSLAELERRISAILINSHPPLATVRPTVPGFIEVGGVHITREPKPLPADIQQFLDGATGGAIFFSLGSNVQSAEMPAKQLKAFLDVFREFHSVRVLWKWEAKPTDKFPANVMVKHWLPQSDVLAHPNVKMFITHGGLMGTQEGVYRGVPMLGIPFFWDQHLNMRYSTRGGFAIALQFSNVTDVSLRWAFGELLYNPSYATQMERASNIFRDRPEQSLDKAMYWVEYVIRHGGAYHLRSAALDLSWCQYFFLDIIGVMVAALIGIWMLLTCAAKHVFGSGKTIKVNKKLKKNE